MQSSDVTIVIAPRERFSHAAASLSSIIAHVPDDVAIFYVDGRTPRNVRRELDRIAEKRPVHFVTSQRYLSPNAARNLGLAHVKTEFVLFVDNDVTVTPGWLDRLLLAADESGADIVGPLILIDVAGRVKVHTAGGEVRIEGTGGKRMLFEKHYHLESDPAEVERLPRTETQFVEYHTLLVRMRLFEEIGAPDERMQSVHEHVDLILLALARGRTIMFEPSSVVTYNVPTRLHGSDVPYFMLRWSDAWTNATLRHFHEKWELDRTHPINSDARGFAQFYRARGLRVITHRAPRTVLEKMKRKVLLRTECLMNRALFPLLQRMPR